MSQSHGAILSDEALQMDSHKEAQPKGVFECQLCGLTAPYSYYGQKPPYTHSVVNVVYSTQKGSASPVLMKTYWSFHWKYDKTWINGSLIRNPTPPKKLMQELKLQGTGRDTAQGFIVFVGEKKVFL
nr:cysteine-rich DPF motif domain-containing protein 1 isoform X3 [Pelodiscus sinensis]|eukprot:XP_014431294.1 cysteine-rich DPF motif domain-containing protein 1 isoform X3 [Pelodiscus sinensis]